MHLSKQNIFIATPIQWLFMVFLYRVFPEVWILFSDKISKVKPSTRLTRFKDTHVIRKNFVEMAEVPLNQSSLPLKTYQQRVQLNCSNTISVLSVSFASLTSWSKMIFRKKNYSEMRFLWIFSQKNIFSIFPKLDSKRSFGPRIPVCPNFSFITLIIWLKFSKI